MAEANPKQFALEELLPVFEAQKRLGHSCVLIGGQSVFHWALRYLPDEPVLQAMQRATSLLSKNIDFQGSREAGIAFARSLGCRAEVPHVRALFGNLMSAKFTLTVSGAPLSVEVLRRVPGLEPAKMKQPVVLDRLGHLTIRVLNPLGVVLAKAWNVVHIQTEGRCVVEQLLVVCACLRAFLRSLLAYAESHPQALRPALKLVETALRFAELPTGRKAAERSGLDWNWMLPHDLLGKTTVPELIRLRGKRLPQWACRIARYRRQVPQSPAALRLLAILTEHAEPVCAPSVRGNPQSAIRNPQSR